MHNAERRIVYILISIADRRRHYVGVTSDLRSRLEWHNEGTCRYTVQDRPWLILVSMEFRTESAARAFAKYLKSGSGRAFAKRHFAAD